MSKQLTIGSVVESVAGIPHYSPVAIAAAGRRLGADPDAVATLIGELMHGADEPVRVTARRNDSLAPVRRFDREGREVT